MTVKVTIVIPFYNDPYIVHALESALSQTYGNIEIIVVDDGSSKYQELLWPYMNKIRYILKEHGGTGSALNQGFREAEGEYIAWLSSDDFFYRHKVELQLKAMFTSGAWISHTAFNYIDKFGRVTDYLVSHAQSDTDLYQVFLRGNPVNGCTVMMRKALYNKVGPFDETLIFTQDLDFWYRVLLLGIPFLSLKQPLTAYRRHEKMGTLLHQDDVMKEALYLYSKYEQQMTALIYRNGIGTE